MDNRIREAYKELEFPEELRQLTLKNILSGQRRKRGIIMKKTGKIKKSAVIVAAVAASLAMTVTAGAAVYNSLFNKEEVNRFYNNDKVGEQLESRGYTDGRSVENEHFRITLQSFVSDDYRGQLVVSAEALDSLGKQYMSDLNGEFKVVAFYTDTGEKSEIGVTLMGTEDYAEGKPMTLECGLEYQIGKQYSIDRTRPLAIKVVCASPNLYNEKEVGKYEDNNLFEGLSIDISPSKYFKSERLYSDDGRELYLSEITVMGMGDYEKRNSENFDLKYKDGTVRSCWGLWTHGGTYYDSDSNTCIGWYWAFNELLDVDSIESVNLDGVEYSRR